MLFFHVKCIIKARLENNVSVVVVYRDKTFFCLGFMLILFGFGYLK
jgi:hypothetical protein